ncbi:MAG: anti-sigma factor [Solirubrobacteraceae bacterium]
MADKTDHLSPGDCSGDAAAYALGALEPDEALAFERHLEQCAVCRDELRAFEDVAHLLAVSPAPEPAPARLRKQVMRVVRQEPRATAAIAPARRWRVPWQVRAGGAAAVLAAIAAAVVITIGQTGGQPTRIVAARVVGVSGSARVRVTGQKGALIVRDLSQPPPGHVYEVWLQRRGAASPFPAGVLFSVTTTGNAQLALPESMRDIGQVLVTPEPDGGSPVPTHSPVIIARLA